MSDTTIGEILVSMGVLTEGQRYKAMEYQRTTDAAISFGQVLVRHGFCTQEQIVEAMKLQAKLRSGKTHDRAEATFDVATRSKEALTEARKQIVATGKAIIEKAGMSDIPTPVLGVPISGG